MAAYPVGKKPSDEDEERRWWRLHPEKTKGKEKRRKWSRGILWPVFKETGGKNRENEISVLVRGNDINLSVSAAPVGGGFRSLNVTLRGRYDLYANIRPVKSSTAVKTPFHDVDIVIFRGNTEGFYVAKEEQIDEETVYTIKIVTKMASEHIIRDAFECAQTIRRAVDHVLAEGKHLSRDLHGAASTEEYVEAVTAELR